MKKKMKEHIFFAPLVAKRKTKYEILSYGPKESIPREGYENEKNTPCGKKISSKSGEYEIANYTRLKTDRDRFIFMEYENYVLIFKLNRKESNLSMFEGLDFSKKHFESFIIVFRKSKRIFSYGRNFLNYAGGIALRANKLWKIDVFQEGICIYIANSSEETLEDYIIPIFIKENETLIGNRISNFGSYGDINSIFFSCISFGKLIYIKNFIGEKNYILLQGKVMEVDYTSPRESDSTLVKRSENMTEREVCEVENNNGKSYYDYYFSQKYYFEEGKDFYIFLFFSKIQNSSTFGGKIKNLVKGIDGIRCLHYKFSENKVSRNERVENYLKRVVKLELKKTLLEVKPDKKIVMGIYFTEEEKCDKFLEMHNSKGKFIMFLPIFKCNDLPPMRRHYIFDFNSLYKNSIFPGVNCMYTERIFASAVFKSGNIISLEDGTRIDYGSNKSKMISLYLETMDDETEETYFFDIFRKK